MRARLASIDAAWAALAAMVAASIVLLAVWGRGLSFTADDFGFAVRLSEQSLGHALFHPPPSKYLIAAPLLVYYTLFKTFGFDSFYPFLATAVLLQALCAGLFFALARRRIGGAWALVPTAILLFFGFGWAEMHSSIAALMAIAAGLAALLVLDRERPHDVAAAALLALSLLSHPLGLAFAAGGAVLILLRGRWGSAWVVVGPVVLYAIWWLFVRPKGGPGLEADPGSIASFIGQSWAAAVASLTGLAGVVSGHAYDHPIGWIAAAVTFAGATALAIAHRHRLPPGFWAAVVALLVLWVLTGVTRSNAFLDLLRPADAPRYLYPAAVLLLLGGVELAGAVRAPAVAALAVCAALALGLAANVLELRDVTNAFRARTTLFRAAFGAASVGDGNVAPRFLPLGVYFYPDAGQYFDAVGAFGSPGFSPSELERQPAPVQAQADRVLVAGEGLSLQPGRAGRAGGAPAPRPKVMWQGRARTSHGCRTVTPGVPTKAARAAPPPASPAPGSLPSPRSPS